MSAFKQLCDCHKDLPEIAVWAYYSSNKIDECIQRMSESFCKEDVIKYISRFYNLTLDHAETVVNHRWT